MKIATISCLTFASLISAGSAGTFDIPPQCEDICVASDMNADGDICYIPSQKYNNKYATCKWEWQTKQCEVGSVFSQSELQCIQKAKLNLQEKPAECKETNEPSPCGPCDSNTTGKDGTCKLGVPNDPTGRYYYACYVRVDMNTCANGLVWDQERKVCYSDV